MASVNNGTTEELQVVARNNQSFGGDGHAYHSIRHAASWDSFQDLSAVTGESGAVISGNQPVAATGSTGDSW